RLVSLREGQAADGRYKSCFVAEDRAIQIDGDPLIMTCCSVRGARDSVVRDVEIDDDWPRPSGLGEMIERQRADNQRVFFQRLNVGHITGGNVLKVRDRPPLAVIFDRDSVIPIVGTVRLHGSGLVLPGSGSQVRRWLG